MSNVLNSNYFYIACERYMCVSTILEIPNLCPLHTELQFYLCGVVHNVTTFIKFDIVSQRSGWSLTTLSTLFAAWFAEFVDAFSIEPRRKSITKLDEGSKYYDTEMNARSRVHVHAISMRRAVLPVTSTTRTTKTRPADLQRQLLNI